ncbi:unnamed protein product, partial [Chrysoparadoxa australica]
ENEAALAFQRAHPHQGLQAQVTQLCSSEMETLDPSQNVMLAFSSLLRDKLTSKDAVVELHGKLELQVLALPGPLGLILEDQRPVVEAFSDNPAQKAKGKDRLEGLMGRLGKRSRDKEVPDALSLMLGEDRGILKGMKICSVRVVGPEEEGDLIDMSNYTA